jgi:hypothetical protein
MIHVNVRNNPAPEAHPFECIVETSTDGAGWKTQYVCSYTIGEQPDNGPRQEAEHIARVMGVAWTYAGVEWRGTSFGYSL